MLISNKALGMVIAKLLNNSSEIDSELQHEIEDIY
jgi:uncharacterized membrane-anchored protein YhcB (DUF1043 family)